MRVHELAKEYGIKSTEFVDVIQSFGFDIKSHLSSLDDAQVSDIRHKMSIKDNQEKEDATLEYAKDLLGLKDSDKEYPPEGFDGDDESDELLERARTSVDGLVEKTDSLKDKTNEMIVKEKEQIEEKLNEVREKQFAEVSRPKGFFGWIASLFS
jgi:translation initiation factor IF-2